MSETIKEQKDQLRAEAKRARQLFSLSSHDIEQLSDNFFDSITIADDSIIGAYWPTQREIDITFLIDDIIQKDITLALPVIQKSSRLLRFAQWDGKTELRTGEYGILQPAVDGTTQWLDPDIFLVPLLAFDQRGNRMGYGGGYYDTTLSHYRSQKQVAAVGMGYAKQACLFNLPTEEHDQKMDWIVTEQSAIKL